MINKFRIENGYAQFSEEDLNNQLEVMEDCINDLTTNIKKLKEMKETLSAEYDELTQLRNMLWVKR
jgi:chromosome segregation ATPase